MTTRVRIGGVYLDKIAPVGDLVDSTIYRTVQSGGDLGWSGDYQASCSWAASPGFSAGWFRRGATFEVLQNGVLAWGGLLSEPEQGDDGWTLSANGYGSVAEEYAAIYDPTGAPPLQPWSVADDVVDQAHTARGCPLNRWSNSLSATAVGVAGGEVVSMATLLDQTAKRDGVRWYVDSRGEVSMVSDPTEATWMTTPNAAYLGTADDEWVSHLYGLYVTSVDTSGNPNGWAIAGPAGGALGIEAAEQFGHRERTVDLTALGLIAGGVASTNLDGRFALIGARMGWTNSVTLTDTNLRRAGWGKGSPMAMYGTNGAGTMLTIPGVMDTHSNPTVGGCVSIVLGQVTRNHADGTVVATPVGYASRDFAGALAAAQPPSDRTDAA